jgi:hypothetical protein
VGQELFLKAVTKIEHKLSNKKVVQTTGPGQYKDPFEILGMLMLYSLL